jgi:single-strand DNA-binding protein
MQELTIIGNLGGDPETKFTKTGAMSVQFSVAVNNKYTDSTGQRVETTTWYRCTGWNAQAESFDKMTQEGWLHKGKQVLIRGDFSVNDWVNQNGEPKYTLEIRIGRLQLLGSKEDSPQS